MSEEHDTPKAPTLDPEKLLLALFRGLDKLQTSTKLDENALAELKTVVDNLQQSITLISVEGSDFRVPGVEHPDGTIECQLAGVPIRMLPDCDIAVGAKQIERQKQQQQRQQ